MSDEVYLWFRNQTDHTCELSFIGQSLRAMLLVFYQCLARHSLYRLLYTAGFSKVIMADGMEFIVQFVHKRDSSGDVQVCDVGVRNVVEILDQYAEAVSMSNNQNRLSLSHQR
ncbi:hypothetical protein [Methylobacter svalbardensis]|uniref:hypothetical protein n=1 Tax=Methylobacter svalbardensis TaxID=3080016 RepID=UPI0030EC8449